MASFEFSDTTGPILRRILSSVLRRRAPLGSDVTSPDRTQFSSVYVATPPGARVCWTRFGVGVS